MSASSAAVGPTTRIIAQAANTATLLIDNISQTVCMPSPGIILYVAFLKGATMDDVGRAVRDVITAKVFPLQSNIDFWKRPQSNEESANESAADERPKPMALIDCPQANVMIIPQATLAGKLKAKAIQYHGQCDKSDADNLFYAFCAQIRGELGLKGEFNKNGVAAMPNANVRTVLNGTFGNRQGLDMSSSGPFTHVFEL
eukprot:GDKK01013905.1.p1 GENE.GDKK01013905.1~~GDKK01013905.1.p1  ORF type:complete len:200 (+),score=2.22 GDKK01013905.1:62-661(+)